MRKKSLSLIDIFIRLAKEHGLTYAELQKLESLGEVKIVKNKLLFKGRDY